MELKSFEGVKSELQNMQNDFNERVKGLLASCEDRVCIRIQPTYLSSVNKNDGYPVQICIWNDNIKDHPSTPIFGNGIKPF